ncbi:MAG: murein biosynthesis integral membrane protein MurJ [Candidatus Abawacabacteria bacterium]|nr:murein biosynthesis integral membrane protein MurJ [Candidatus Abawacabacteria bacterium]
MAIKSPLKNLFSLLRSGSILLAVSSLISRALGLLRDRLLTHTFGASRLDGTISELDAYYAAFQLPDLLYQIIILGTISACFIPYFSELYTEKKVDAWKLANNTMTSIMIVMTLLVIGSIVFSKHILYLLIPGLDPATQELTLAITRIMLVSPLFFSISAITGAISNSLKRFAAFAITPILYNAAIILAILVLTPKYGIYGVSIGVVVGSFLHAMIQTFSAWQAGFRPKFYLDWENGTFRQMIKSSIPRLLALAVARINILVDTMLASLLVAGSITIFNLAQNIQSLPMGVVGVSIAVASFPVFSNFINQKKHVELHELICEKTRKVIYVLLPLTILTILLRTEGIRLLFGSGRFNWVDTVITANTLGLFALSFISQSLLPIITRIFYAYKDTVSPLWTSLVTIVTNVVLSILFIFIFNREVVSLALSFTIASFVQLILSLYQLRKKYQLKIFSKHDSAFYAHTITASLCLAIAAQLMKEFSGTFLDPLDSFLKVSTKIALTVGVSATIYLVIQTWFGHSLKWLLRKQ